MPIDAALAQQSEGDAVAHGFANVMPGGLAKDLTLDEFASHLADLESLTPGL